MTIKDPLDGIAEQGYRDLKTKIMDKPWPFMAGSCGLGLIVGFLIGLPL